MQFFSEWLQCSYWFICKQLLPFLTESLSELVFPLHWRSTLKQISLELPSSSWSSAAVIWPSISQAAKGHGVVLRLFKASEQSILQLLTQMLCSLNTLFVAHGDWHASFPWQDALHSSSILSFYSEFLQCMHHYAKGHRFFRSLHGGLGIHPSATGHATVAT